MPRRVYTEAFASVRFFGERLDPLDVTIALELPPDHQHRRGEPTLSRTKAGAVRRYADHSHGQWRMSSRAWVDSPRLEVHLDWLLSQLEDRKGEIEGLLAGGAEADFFCFSTGSSNQPPGLPKSIRDRADALGIPIEIDHYPDFD